MTALKLFMLLFISLGTVSILSTTSGCGDDDGPRYRAYDYNDSNYYYYRDGQRRYYHNDRDGHRREYRYNRDGGRHYYDRDGDRRDPKHPDRDDD